MMIQTPLLVTSFFDIGRGEWKNRWARSTENYLFLFSRLALLKNEMVVFTNLDVDRISALRGDRPTRIVSMEPTSEYEMLFNKISHVMENDFFKSKITSDIADCPEYWDPKYVLVNIIKSFLVVRSLEILNKTEGLTSWIDFGYFREPISNVESLELSLPEDRISILGASTSVKNQNVTDMVFANQAWLYGGAIIGGPSAWLRLNDLAIRKINLLLSLGLIDDDQTIWMLACLEDPSFFNILTARHTLDLLAHRVNSED